MTELEQARAHLQCKHWELETERKNQIQKHPAFRNSPSALKTQLAEYLAALSWVWDAQERAWQTNPVAWLNETFERSLSELLGIDTSESEFVRRFTVNLPDLDIWAKDSGQCFVGPTITYPDQKDAHEQTVSQYRVNFPSAHDGLSFRTFRCFEQEII